MAGASQTGRVAGHREGMSAPQPMTDGPGLYLPGRPAYLFFMDAGRVTVASLDPVTRTATAPDAALIEVLSELVGDKNDCKPRNGEADPKGAPVAIFTDRVAFNALNSLMTDASGPQRMMKWRRPLPHSGFLPILTDSLKARYGSPERIDAASVLAWAKALGIEVAAGSEGMVALGMRLLGLVTQGRIGYQSWATGMGRAEKNGLKSMFYNGTSDAYRSHEAIAAALAGLRALDVNMLANNTETGAIYPVQVNSTAVAGFLIVSVDGGFRFKPGSRVAAFVPGTSTMENMEVSSISLDPAGDRLNVRLRVVSAFGRKHRKWAHGDRFYLTDSPFLGASSPRLDRRWKETQDRVVHIGAPADVLLAGAPDTI